MDPLDLITDPTLHSYAIIALTATSLAMPLLEWVANRTATDLDNRAVALLARVLSFVPRVRLGNTKLSAATVARTSKMPPPIAPLACVFLLLGCAGAPTTREALDGAKRAQESMERMCEELARTKALREEVTDALDTLAPAGVDGGAPADVAPVQPAETAPMSGP